REVARAAGVSVETVYASFRSKGDLLLAAIDVAVVGDAAPVPWTSGRNSPRWGPGPGASGQALPPGS
ncbi:MAG: TetR/AcrR family transcriptional regulator, partial [Streptosporangiaceae bacterium]